ncbi:hypothetical protein PAMP_011906 [Pampus punctatissimus]
MVELVTPDPAGRNLSSWIRHCLSLRETLVPLHKAAVVTEERWWTSRVQMLSMRPRQEEHPVRRPQPYGMKRRTPLELLAFFSRTEAHCSGPALRAT